MEIINVQPLANATNLAVRAMIDILGLVIVEKIANLAEVACHASPATYTIFGRRLHHKTLHTHHFCNFPAVDLMVRRFVVTKPTGEEFVTTRHLDLATALVVLAPENTPFFFVEGRELRVLLEIILGLGCRQMRSHQHLHLKCPLTIAEIGPPIYVKHLFAEFQVLIFAAACTGQSTFVLVRVTGGVQEGVRQRTHD